MYRMGLCSTLVRFFSLVVCGLHLAPDFVLSATNPNISTSSESSFAKRSDGRISGKYCTSWVGIPMKLSTISEETWLPAPQHLNIPAQHHFLFLIVSVLSGKSDMSCLPSVSALFWSSANLNLLACSFGFLPQCPHMYGSKPRPHCPLANGKKHTWLCYISLDFAKLAKLNNTNSLPEHRGCASTMEFSSFKVYESTLFATMWSLS